MLKKPRAPSRLLALPRPLRWAGALLLLFALLWGLVLPLATEPLLRWGLQQAEQGLGGHRIAFASARLSPWKLAIEVDGLRLLPPQEQEALVELDRLQVDFDLPGSIAHRALALDQLRLDAPRLRLSLLPERTNWTALLQALQPQAPDSSEPQAPPPRLRIALLQLERGRFDYRDARRAPLRSSFADALQLELRDLSTLPEERGAYQLAAQTALGARLRWRGGFALQPLQADGELQAEGLELAKLWALLPTPPLAVLPPAGKAGFALRYALRDEAGQALDLKLEGLKLQLDGLALQGLQASEPALRLPQLRLEGGSLDLRQHHLQLGRLSLDGGQLQLALAADGRVDLQDWLPAGADTAEAEIAPGPRWRIDLQTLALKGLALRVDDAGFASPQRFELAQLALGLGLQAEVGGSEAMALQLRHLQLSAGGLRAGDWLRLDNAALDGGELDLRARRLALGAIRLQQPELQVQRAANGSLPLLAALQRPGRSPKGTAAADPSWDLQIGPLTLEAGSLQIDDRATQPPGRWRLQALQAKLEGLGGATLRTEAQAELASGGRLCARGELQPQLDLRLRLDALALPPLQPLLAAYTPLRLASGRLQAQGRLRVSKDWRFEGGARMESLRLDEASGPLLQLRRLDAPRLRASPSAYELGRLDAQGLQTKLLFDKERRVNWAGLWRSPASQAPAPAPAVTSPSPRLRLERLRLRDVQLDFVDLSLALPFAARIHRGEGEFVGLDTAAGSPPARLRFDGQVDEFGSARAEGSLQALAPTAFSDIAVRFRNVEMTTLTPYTATFAGRRIASGKLDLDLEYKLRERQLQGDNRVVMQTLTLGEKIDSPSATSLPLDLAIALLEDSEGRIDLNLPVSGSLDEPEFSYGGLVWKVIVNVLTKIVTSPFRALGSLLGGEQELADRISFDAGSASLLPPEREKLKLLAQALAKRPGLALQLAAGFDAERDAAALKDLQLRRALARLQGRPADEDPGLLLLGEAGTQAALRELFSQRFGEAALRSLQQRHALAQPAPPPGLAQRLLAGVQQLAGRAPESLSPAEREVLQGKALPELLWQRLLANENLAPEALQQLGSARAAAMAAQLQTQGLDAQRLRLAEAAPLQQPAAEGPVALPLGATTMR